MGERCGLWQCWARRGAEGGHGALAPRTPYLGSWEEWQRKLYQALDLDLHGGEGALEDGESLQGGGVGSSHRAAQPLGTPPTPGSMKWGARVPCTCWKGLLRLWSQYR